MAVSPSGTATRQTSRLATGTVGRNTGSGSAAPIATPPKFAGRAGTGPTATSAPATPLASRERVMSSLLVRPASIMAVSAESVPPDTDSGSRIVNGAPSATRTAIRAGPGASRSSLSVRAISRASGNGVPGFRLRERPRRLLNPTNTFGGNDRIWLSPRNSHSRSVKPPNRPAGSPFKPLCWRLRPRRRDSPANTRSGSRVSPAPSYLLPSMSSD